MTRIIRTAFLPALALLALASCETAQGFKRDTGKLWASIENGFSGSNDQPAGTAQTAASRQGDDSLMPPVSSDCPAMVIMPELKHIAEFTDPSKPSDKTKISEFTMMGVQSKCQQHDAALAMHIELIFSGEIGPKGRANKSDKPNFSYPYFIAVTDDKGAVVSKEIFAANVSYGTDQKDSKQIESITQTLPVKSKDEMSKYKVLVGFQLDETQLAYNRNKQK